MNHLTSLDCNCQRRENIFLNLPCRVDERSNEIIDTQCWKLKAHYACYRMVLPLSSNLGLRSLSSLPLKTFHSLSSIKSCSEIFPYYSSLHAFGVLFVVAGPIATYQQARLFLTVPSLSKLSSQHLQVDFRRKNITVTVSFL